MLCLSDSGGEVDGGGESGMMGCETVEACFGLMNESNFSCLPR